ncbi:MAG: hypothetical protein MJ059_08910 [Lachnospiraceae bacterium]|nr:hypothetical protein [Lachnospiraceae bacterium]
MNNFRNKKRIFLITVAVICCHMILCGFGVTPDIAELKVKKPFVDLDLMVKDSVGTNGAEEVKKEEAEPSSAISPGTDAEKTTGETVIRVKGNMIKLDGGLYSTDFDDFSKKFNARYNRNMTVRLIDEYADAETFKNIQSLFWKKDITPVVEQIDE